MTKDIRELVAKFRKLNPENQANALSNMRVAYAVQENTRRSMTRSIKTSAKKQKTS